jgi:hypothetical protein
VRWSFLHIRNWIVEQDEVDMRVLLFRLLGISVAGFCLFSLSAAVPAQGTPPPPTPAPTGTPPPWYEIPLLEPIRENILFFVRQNWQGILIGLGVFALFLLVYIIVKVLEAEGIERLRLR